jgi:hypothetical protein
MTGSAFPASVEDLLPRVRERIAESGRTPSRNWIMTEFKVGAPKAKAILAELDGTSPPHLGPGPEGPSGRALHSVPEPEPDHAGDEASDVPAPGTPEGAVPQIAPVADPGVDAGRDGTVQPVPAAPAAAVKAGSPRAMRVWPVLLPIAAGAFVAIWGGWVGLGKLTGFGPIQLLPGIWDELVLNTAITLPIGVETYAAVALRVWLASGTRSLQARRFAKWSAFGSLGLGMAGQVAYHLMSAAGVTVAPWWITTFVSCLPVVVLGCGAALMHLMHAPADEQAS